MQNSIFYRVAIVSKSLFTVPEGMPKMHKRFPAIQELKLRFKEISAK